MACLLGSGVPPVASLEVGDRDLPVGERFHGARLAGGPTTTNAPASAVLRTGGGRIPGVFVRPRRTRAAPERDERGPALGRVDLLVPAHGVLRGGRPVGAREEPGQETLGDGASLTSFADVDESRPRRSAGTTTGMTGICGGGIGVG